MSDDARSRLLERVGAALDEHVRPDLAELGGDVELIGIDEDAIVQIRLLGDCGGCAPTIYQWTLVVESILKAHVPEIRVVEALP